MARFVKYYIRYKHCFGPYDWEKRQDHLAALFEKDDNIAFGEGCPSEEQRQSNISYARMFNHRVYHLECNPNIIVMQFANSIDIPMEINYEKSIAKNEPSCFVIIDNRKDMRTIAIQNRHQAFTAPKRVADILSKRINEVLFSQYCYQAEILPEYYPEDLFEAWEELQRNTQTIKFITPQNIPVEEIRRNIDQLRGENKEYFDDSIMPALLEMYLAAKEAKYKQMWAVSREERKEAIYIDKNSRYMKNLLTLARASNTPVELVTSDGASFRCFIESDEENTDKIIHRNLDADLLEILFNKKKEGEKAEHEDIVEAEGKILEMLNDMKHHSVDIETNEDVA